MSVPSRSEDCTVQADVLAFAKAIAKSGKPIGFICIAPAMIPRIYGAGAELTIGNDSSTAAAITQMGGIHQNCPVRATVIDRERKIVSTPAYMLAHSIAEAADGIERLVKEVLAMAR
jgi:enhancing lycopene biosynthesis protein 2